MKSKMSDYVSWATGPFLDPSKDRYKTNKLILHITLCCSMGQIMANWPQVDITLYG